jgi:alpha-beta hydrolase superfamily lysophospholipase
MVHFEQAPRNLKYPKDFYFPAMDTAITGFMVNDKGHRIAMALFLPQGDIESIFAISPATGRIIEDDKLIIEHALASGQAVLAVENYGSGLSTNPVAAPRTLGSKDFYELGQDFLNCISIAKSYVPNVPVKVLGCSMGALVAIHAAVLDSSYPEDITTGVPLLGEKEMTILNRYLNIVEAPYLNKFKQPQKWLKKLKEEYRQRIEQWESAAELEPFPCAFDEYTKSQEVNAHLRGDRFQIQLHEIRNLNPHVHFDKISKQFIYHAARACNRLEKARGKFLSRLGNININILQAMDDELVDNGSLLTLASRLAAVNPNVRVISYEGASHNLLLEDERRKKVLSDVQVLNTRNESLEPHIQDFSWYENDQPKLAIHTPLYPELPKMVAAFRRALWVCWSGRGGTKPPYEMLKDLAHSVGGAVDEAFTEAGHAIGRVERAIEDLSTSTTPPHSEPERQDHSPSSI